LERCVTYVEKGGADLIWLNSVESREDLRRACKEIPAPVLVIWGGRDLPPTNAEFDKMGVRIALYPTCCPTAGLQTAWELLHEVKTGGARALAEFNARAGQSKWGKAEQGTLVQVGRVRQIEERYLPKEARRDYAGTWGHKSDYSDALK